MGEQLALFEDPASNQSAMGGFEGASNLSRELALWNAPLRSADAELIFEKDTLDARALDLQRNDGYINGAIQHHKDSIVGAFYRLNAKPNAKYLGLDETWAEEFQAAVEERFGLAAESPNCWFDAAGRLTFSEMVRLAVGVSIPNGECLATAEWFRNSRRPFRTAIQMVDPIRLSNPYGIVNDITWRKGVKCDSYGRPIQYAIRTNMPGDFWNFEDTFKWRLIPATKPWGRKLVLHYYDPTRIDQTRGISDLVAILKQSKMVGKYQDIVLQNAVLNATYAAVIESDLPPAEAFESLGSSSEGMTGWIAQYLAGMNKYLGKSTKMHIDGVKIPHTYPGTKLKLQNAGQPGGVGTNFEESLLRHLAAGLGLSYEEFSHDFTKTNYSSARAAMGETWKRMQGRKKTVADKFASDVYRLWFEEQLNSGAFSDVLPKKAPNFYEALNADAYTACSWIGAPRGQIDELKETEAAIARIEAGLSTYEKECARFGEDFRHVFRQRKREENMKKKMGLEFGKIIRPSHDFETTKSGSSNNQSAPANGSNDNSGNQ